jgi:hypothetical protein
MRFAPVLPSPPALRRAGLATALAIAIVGGPAPHSRAQSPARPARPSIEEWLPSLQTGLWIKIEGEWADGVLRADEVKVVHGELDQAEVSSLVVAFDSVTARIRTQLGVEIAVSKRTQFEKEARRGWSAVTVGALVEAEGPIQRDGTLLADELEIKAPRSSPRPAGAYVEQELTGRIDAVDAAARTLTVFGVTVRCDAQTRNKTRFIH